MRSALALLLAAACAPMNQALSTRPAGDKPYTEETFHSDTANSDSLYVALAFSGGGTRAAAFSYGVLQRLKNTKVTVLNQERRLIDEIDLISSVSGGSFTAAYLALKGPDALFADFPQRFLFRDIQLELALHAFASPLGLLRLPSHRFDRIDSTAEIYDRTIFDRATFSDLVKRGRKPYVVLNASNMAQERGFQFTQNQFDLLGSDLNSYPIAWAVAASSAFPFLLSPVTVKNFGSTVVPDYLKREPKYLLNRGEYLRLHADLELMNACVHPYVHLLDGGLGDNTGLHYILHEVADQDGYLFGLIKHETVQKVLIIAVNANTTTSPSLDRSRRGPGFFSVLSATSDTAMDEATDDIVNHTREVLAGLRDPAMKQPDDKVGGVCVFQGTKVRYYYVNVEFELLGQNGVTDQVQQPRDVALRKHLQGLGTTFALPEEDVRKLIDAGDRILGESPCFQRFLAEMEASP